MGGCMWRAVEEGKTQRRGRGENDSVEAKWGAARGEEGFRKEPRVSPSLLSLDNGCGMCLMREMGGGVRWV